MKEKRVGNIQVRKSFGRWEIVKWFKNPYYGKEGHYLKIDDNTYKAGPCSYIDASVFKNPESCYQLASFREGSESFDLKFTGTRPFELDSIGDETDFFDLAKEAALQLDKEKREEMS